MTDPRNPYAPPAAPVADIAPGNGAGFQPVRVFSVKGRIGRLRYLSYLVRGWLVLCVAWGFGGALWAPLRHSLPAGSDGVMVWLLLALYLVFVCMAGIQRCHDMGWPGWAALFTLVPLAALLWIVIPGAPGANRFGLPPPPNTFAVKLFGVVVPIIVLVIFVGAIAVSFYGAMTMDYRVPRGP